MEHTHFDITFDTFIKNRTVLLRRPYDELIFEFSDNMGTVVKIEENFGLVFNDDYVYISGKAYIYEKHWKDETTGGHEFCEAIIKFTKDVPQLMAYKGEHSAFTVNLF